MSDPTLKRGPLTAAEIDSIADLAERGFSAFRIAGILRRHPGAVTVVMRTLGYGAPSKRAPILSVRNGRRLQPSQGAPL